MTDTRLRRRRVLALTAAGVLGVFAVLPHPLEHLAQFFGTGVLIAIAAAAGTVFAPRVGLVTTIIDAALSRQPFAARARSNAALAVGVDVAVALAIVALDVVVFAPLVPETRTVAARPLWTGALAALYGGLSEETSGATARCRSLRGYSRESSAAPPLIGRRSSSRPLFSVSRTFPRPTRSCRSRRLS